MQKIPVTAVSILLLSSLLLCSCSSAFVYNRIDTIAQLYISRYIDLDKEQSRSLKAELEALKEWHRQGELADYIMILEEIEADLQHEVGPETVDRWMGHFEQAWVDLRDRAMPAVIEVAASLDTGQVGELAGNMEKRNREQEKEFRRRDAGEYEEHIYEEMEERLEYWLGRLSKPQRERLQRAAVDYERLDQAWLAGRREWQAKVITVLDHAPGWEERLVDLLVNRTDYPDPEDAGADRRNEQRIFTAVAEVLNMRTPRQSEHLFTQINEWKDNLRTLQGSGQPAS